MERQEERGRERRRENGRSIPYCCSETEITRRQGLPKATGDGGGGRRLGQAEAQGRVIDGRRGEGVARWFRKNKIYYFLAITFKGFFFRNIKNSSLS